MAKKDPNEFIIYSPIQDIVPLLNKFYKALYKRIEEEEKEGESIEKTNDD